MSNMFNEWKDINYFVNNTYYEFGENEKLPTFLNKVFISTKKNGHLFSFIRSLKIKEDRHEKLGNAVCVYGQFKMHETNNEKPFIFIIVEGDEIGKPKGVIVSDQLYNYYPTNNLLNIYREAKGLEKVYHEKDLFDDLLPYIQKTFPEKRYTIEVQPAPDEKRKVPLSSDRVKDEYIARFGEVSRALYIVPDFVLYDKKWSGKQLFIEVERKKRNPEDIKKKLFKLHYADKKIFYIFENDFVRDHFLDVIYEFQKEEVNGKRRKFKSLNYTTKNEFMFFTNESIFTRFT